MKKLAEVFKAIGDPVRLAIINILLGKKLCVCDILDAFNVSQPTISHHLKVLKQAGLVTDNREGKWIYYSLDSEKIESLHQIFKEIAEKSVIKE